VPRRQPLVAEHPTDLEHPGHAAGHEALQVQLRCDAQVQVDVEGVVVGDERLGERAAGDRLQERRLDLDVAAVHELGSQRVDDRSSLGEHPSGVGVHREVDPALPVAGLGVLEAMPLVGRGAATCR
jgi:hypothetical protein